MGDKEVPPKKIDVFVSPNEQQYARFAVLKRTIERRVRRRVPEKQGIRHNIAASVPASSLGNDCISPSSSGLQLSSGYRHISPYDLGSNQYSAIVIKCS